MDTDIFIHNQKSTDTICAIATAQGGAIGIIRVSGNNAINAVSAIFQPKRPVPLSERDSYSIVYGNIMDSDDSIVDDVLVSLFRAPNSYTGEDSVEISCHGSSYILQKVMQLLINEGCRSARPGEYTQRAFINGKMDLSQAEAVADLIASENKATHKLAMSQMKGGFSKQLKNLRHKLLEMTSLLELELDFSEEDVEFADRQKLKSIAIDIDNVIGKLTDSFKTGNAIKNGIPVAIIGETNVGKSTLLNRLLHEDKAIVSDIEGTTRDVIEDHFTIGGINFRFMDTAGIRETSDVVENLGIQRTFSMIKDSQIVLWIIDASQLTKDIDSEKDNRYISEGIRNVHKRIIPLCADKQLIVVLNKCDIVSDEQFYDIYRIVFSDSGINENEIIRISAKKGDNISALEDMLVDAAGTTDFSDNDIIVTNIRHYDALIKAQSSIRNVIEAISNSLSGDLISEDLRQCLHHLGEIVGEVTNDEVLSSIFSRFCVGK